MTVAQMEELAHNAVLKAMEENKDNVEVLDLPQLEGSILHNVHENIAERDCLFMASLFASHLKNKYNITLLI